MAQRVLQQWKDQINAFEANERTFGPVSPGRIRGYDNITEGASDASDVKLSLGHQSNRSWETPGTSGYSGIEISDDTNVLDSALGLAVMMNGTLVIEDATVGSFDIPINIAAGERQRNWVVAEHTWTEIGGGSAVTYQVISGTVSTGSSYNEPILTNAALQVVIAEFDCPKTAEGGRGFANIISISRGAIQSFSNGRNAAQLIIDADLISNTDLETNYYNKTEVDAFIESVKPYDVYTALISQVGVNDPTSIIIGTNDIGTIVWTRTGVGIYVGTLAGKFDLDKTHIMINQPANGGNNGSLSRSSDDTVDLFSYVSGSLADDVLIKLAVEIRVYH